MRYAWLLLPLWLAACGSGISPPPRDEAMEQAFTAGRLLSTQKEPQAAQVQFETAYQRAVLRDDAAAIADAGYDLAVVQLAQGQAAEALATISRARVALGMRGRLSLPGLSLVQAASLHRLGQDREAMAVARSVTTDPDKGVAARATFLVGLAADAQGDVPTLAAACDVLRAPARSPARAREADADELAARLALRRDDPGAAERAALAASAGRRTLLDYRGMRTALGLAARAAERAGEAPRAAAYEQQAAQSLALDR